LLICFIEHRKPSALAAVEVVKQGSVHVA